MKIFAPILLSLSVIITLASCQKEVSSEPGYTGSGAGVNGTLKFKVEGTQWVANKLAGAYIMAGKINITGQSKDGRMFTMTLSDTKARKYILTNVISNFDSAHFAAFTDTTTIGNDSWGTEQGDDTTLAGGWVNVSKIDNSKETMSGTFEMKMFREQDSSIIHITEGVFENLHFETSLPPASASDTFTVKIEGT